MKGTYKGYTVYDDGTVYSLLGRPLKVFGKYPTVKVKGEQWQLAHLVVFVLTGFKPYRVSWKDGDRENCSLKNLEWR